MNPLVSIIVPVYNVEKYLGRCLDSLVNQTIEDIEIIVVNDGSIDQSIEIIEEYRYRYPEKIKVYNKLNGGIADARNFGLEHVNASYFGFLDSDDYMEPNTLELMYQEAISTDSDIVMSDFWWTYPNHEKVSIDGPFTTNKQLLTSMFATLWNKLYRTEFIESINVRFPKGYRYEDASFLYKIVPFVKKWSYINKPFVHYVQREGSITHNHNERVKDMIFVFEDLIDFYIKRNIFKEYYYELEYLFIRFFLGNSFLRSTQIEDRTDRKNTLRIGFNLLNRNFPNWKKNPVIKKDGFKYYYFKSINPITYKLYSEFFSFYYEYIKKDKLG